MMVHVTVSFKRSSFHMRIMMLHSREQPPNTRRYPKNTSNIVLFYLLRNSPPLGVSRYFWC